ncbi:MAG: hypothetical protein B7Y36_07170 [Novosphingobium sp. 28-62-57]|nr:MAG: hypothetical protein B7Z34_01850 [Novosphingobium sp. 12-62-10]OYZ11211.1 MAG: hypothetical protein B7Y36_07170 [Novosphingobium sp. 28-62-57]OYZ22899.1 MAG: hypothetical protein B7Y31_14590 [Novosphingobium sp. 16-62-11]OZA30858.1 MAG: hypothetical protein B7X92_15530 [Novosphingobium sp. 17-62-9]
MKNTALGLVAALTAGSTLVVAVPASAAALPQTQIETASQMNLGRMDMGSQWNWDDDDDDRRWGDRRGWNDRRGRDDRRWNNRNNWNGNRGYWRGNDGRYYCRRNDGTTGLLIGGVAGALVGREVAGRRGDRTLGAVLGAAGGALLGREVDRGGSRCR